MELTIDKSIPEDADMLGQCKTGDMVTITGKITSDDTDQCVIEVEKITGDNEDAEGENPSSDENESSEDASDEPAGEEMAGGPARGKSRGPAMAILFGNRMK